MSVSNFLGVDKTSGAHSHIGAAVGAIGAAAPEEAEDPDAPPVRGCGRGGVRLGAVYVGAANDALFRVDLDRGHCAQIAGGHTAGDVLAVARDPRREWRFATAGADGCRSPFPARQPRDGRAGAGRAGPGAG